MFNVAASCIYTYFIIAEFEYIPDSEITGQTVSISEDDLLDKVCCFYLH